MLRRRQIPEGRHGYIQHRASFSFASAQQAQRTTKREIDHAMVVMIATIEANRSDRFNVADGHGPCDILGEVHQRQRLRQRS